MRSHTSTAASSQLLCALLVAYGTLQLKFTFLPRDAVHSADCAVAICPSVCPRPFCVKTYNVSSDFSPSGRHTILVFPHQTLWQYSDGDP